MKQPSIWIPPDGAARLAKVVAHAFAHSPAQRERLAAADVDPAAVAGPASLVRVPVMRKSELGSLQAEQRPFGGLLGGEVGDLARIFLSPGDLYDPQGAGPDYWRFGRALAAAGFGRGDIVLNCFSYHLSPAGFIFDAAARACGAVVIPAGVGQMEMQLKVLADTGANAFVGLPSYLLALLERGASFTKAFVSAEPLPPSLRARLEAYGVAVFQGYGTADLGLVAYECTAKQGMHLDEGVILEICDPDGQPVTAGEIGEVVVTLLDPTYPLIRFGTGDLSALVTEPCSCGRASLRMRGWLGRANDVVKVRGMFVYPRQLEEAMSGFAGRWQAVVERDESYRDRLILQVEGPADGVGEAVRSATRLNAEVVQVAEGTILPGAPALDDRRRWE